MLKTRMILDFWNGLELRKTRENPSRGTLSHHPSRGTFKTKTVAWRNQVAEVGRRQKNWDTLW